MRYWRSFAVSTIFSALYGWLEYYYITAPLFVMTEQQESLAYPWWANAPVFLGFTVYHLTIMLLTAVFVTFLEPYFFTSLRLAVSRRMSWSSSYISGSVYLEKRLPYGLSYTITPYYAQVPSPLGVLLVFVRNILTFALLEDIFWFIFNLALPIPILATQPWYQRLWQPGDWTCRFGYVPTPFHFVIPIWYIPTIIVIVIIQAVLEHTRP